MLSFHLYGSSPANAQEVDYMNCRGRILMVFRFKPQVCHPMNLVNAA